MMSSQTPSFVFPRPSTARRLRPAKGGRAASPGAGVTLAVALACWVSTGCSGGGGTAGTGGASGTGGRGASSGGSASGGSGTGGGSAAERLLGTFAFKMTAPVPASGTTAAVPGSTSIVGRVSDGPTPALSSSKQTAAEGSCRLEVPATPFCATPCGSAVCVADGVCQSYPTAKNLGTVTMSGVSCSVGSTNVELENTKNTYQLPQSVSCSYPGFAEGDAVSLKTSGGDLSPLTLATHGIASLVLSTTDLPLVADQPLVLKWNAAKNPQASHMHVKMDISHHGGSRGWVACDSDDTGTVTIAGSLVTKLLALGVAGFPTVILTRTATGSAIVGDGHVDFIISSEVQQEVKINGLLSCNGDEDCIPYGKTCHVEDLTCQ